MPYLTRDEIDQRDLNKIMPNIEYRGHVTLPVTNNHAVKSNNCDCSIDGDGSADKPLFIRYCVAHSAGYGLFALWEDKQAKK